MGSLKPADTPAPLINDAEPLPASVVTLNEGIAPGGSNTHVPLASHEVVQYALAQQWPPKHSPEAQLDEAEHTAPGVGNGVAVMQPTLSAVAVNAMPEETSLPSVFSFTTTVEPHAP